MMAAQSRKSLQPFALRSRATMARERNSRQVGGQLLFQIGDNSIANMQVPVTALLSSLPTGKQGKERPAEIELSQLNPETKRRKRHPARKPPGPMKIDAMFHKPFLAIEQCNRSSSA